MPTNRNIVDMVEAIRSGGRSAGVGETGKMHLAVVTSVEPLTIKMYGKDIQKNIYINPALVQEASDSGEKMKKLFCEKSETPTAYQFLKEFHEKYVLKTGDTVLVFMSGSFFYIAGKAVRV